MNPQNTDIIQRYEAMKNTLTAAPVKPGMNVRVHVLIREGDKERIQPFEGMVITVQGKGMGRTFTVRRLVRGIGVERVFPLYSPVITNIEILGAERVRRAKLSFLRKVLVKRRKREDFKTLKRAQDALQEQQDIQNSKQQEHDEQSSSDAPQTESEQSK